VNGAPARSSTVPSANAPIRTLGPERSCRIATGIASSSARRRSRWMVSRCSSGVPWEKLSRATFIPAWRSALNASSVEVAGPIVATIFVRRSLPSPQRSITMISHSARRDPLPLAQPRTWCSCRPHGHRPSLIRTSRTPPHSHREHLSPVSSVWWLAPIRPSRRRSSTAASSSNGDDDPRVVPSETASPTRTPVGTTPGAPPAQDWSLAGRGTTRGQTMAV
jgi:hypothetical protein